MQIELAPEVVQQVEAAATAEGIPVDQFLREAVEARLKQNAFARASVLPEESDFTLLERINRGFSADFWERFRFLAARRDEETLTPDEQIELIGMSDAAEARQVERLEQLTQLAQRRGVPVRDLMDQLGIRPVRVS